MLLFDLWQAGIEVVIMFMVIIIFAFAYHELAHAIVADRLGDPTPRRAGRITLNPLPHLSLPLLVMLMLFGFGGAYTPVSPGNFDNPRRDYALVAVAGPLANLLMAAIFGWIIRLIDGGILPMDPLLLQFANLGVFLNVFLMVFNLIPIPPLDGFSILQGVLPGELARSLDPLRQYGLLIILAAFFLLPNAGIDLFNDYIFPTIRQIQSLLVGTPF